MNRRSFFRGLAAGSLLTSARFVRLSSLAPIVQEDLEQRWMAAMVRVIGGHFHDMKTNALMLREIPFGTIHVSGKPIVYPVSISRTGAQTAS